VARTHPPYYGGGYYPRYRHYPYYPYYGWGWGWGGYYAPFVSFYGWYPYSFGFGWYGGYPYYPYYAYGPYDASASVRVQVTPREAEVYVDGYYAGVVDDFDGTFQRLNLVPGSHEVTIYLPGYRSATERRYYGPSASYKIKQALEKLPTGQPDDPKPQPVPRAQSPIRPEGDPDAWDVEGERRQPEPRWPDPMDPRTAPPPRAGDEPPPSPEAGVRRGGAPASPYGSLVVRVQPEGSTVVIDGEHWQGPGLEGRLTVQLAEGRHRVEIRKDGYTPYSADVDVRAGESTPLNVSLPPTDRR
jgi:hypothetical protein